MTARTTRTPAEQFRDECEAEIEKQGRDESLGKLTRDWVDASIRAKYSYHFEWMGRPIIQYPQDMVAMQEILWRVRPDWIVETGVAHGGSLVYYASILELIGKGEVVGVDIDIRPHNREAIESHAMSKRIQLIQGSSIDTKVVDQVRQLVGNSTVLVVLDSNHTHDHVLAELELYAPLVSIGSYCVVMDTVVEHLPASYFPDRPWGPGQNPKTAVKQYLASNSNFEIDQTTEDKLLITVAPGGYLKRVR